MPDPSAALRRYLEISREPAGSAFHTSQVSINFGEAIDPGSLRRAWEAVAAAHAALRAVFQPDGALGEAVFAWQELDWQTAPPDDLGAAWQALVQDDAATPVAAEPVRITLIRLPNGQGHALWTFHAALLDDASISLALQEWLVAYDYIRLGEEAPAFADSDAAAPLGDSVPLEPPIILPRPDSAEAGVRRSLARTFERDERAAFVAAAKSLRRLFGAAWSLVLARATAAADVVLLEATRPDSGIGRHEVFAARRHAVEAHPTPADLFAAFEDEAPLGDEPRIAAAPAAFIARAHTLNDDLQLALPRWMAADVQLFQKTAPPLALRVIAGDRPEVALDYDPAAIADDAAHQLFEAVTATALALAADPKLDLAAYALPGRAAIIAGPEAPALTRSLVPQGLHETFADLAAESPDAPAVEAGEERLTFAQLNSAANQLARFLRKRGVAPGARVGLALARSPRWVTALLGALKAGCVVVPLSEAATEADVQAWIVDALPEGAERKEPVIQLQAEAGAVANEKSRGIQSETAPDAVAIAAGDESFTHQEFAAAVQSAAALLALTPADRVLQFAPAGTSAALEETLATLLSGATLVLRADNRWSTRTAFQEFVQDSAITALTVPTPFWSQWTHYLGDLSIRVPETLRIAAIRGAHPAPHALAAWQNAAGSTRLLLRKDTSRGPGLVAEPNPGDALAGAILGQPAPGMTARLVDGRHRPVPFGLFGAVETGAADKFAPLAVEAFASSDGLLYEREPLETLVTGRAAEARAVWTAAVTHKDVHDAYADKRLVAAREEWCLWIVPRDSQRGEPHDFREWLTSRLPSAPRRIRAVPRLPLDEAGDIDTAALADLLPEDAAAPVSRKGSEIEERVRQAISRVLGGRRIELDEILADGRTKPQVAKLLFEAVSREESRVELADFTTGFSVRSLLRNVRGRRSGGSDHPWTPLQPLRASGKLPPLVFIHDLDGTAKPYAALVAQLGEDQPCYALTARGLTDPAGAHATVEEMARAYVEALRVFDAAGPYRLLGYGFGGLVAFEMGRQLTASRAPVSLAVALATEPPAGNSAASFLAGGWKRALFGRRTEDDSRRRRGAAETPVFQANREAARKYSVFGRLDVPLHVFAPERDFPSYREIQGGWSAVCDDAHFYQVPCSGPEMMDEPAVEAVANAINKLARAEALDAELEE